MARKRAPKSNPKPKPKSTPKPKPKTRSKPVKFDITKPFKDAIANLNKITRQKQRTINDKNAQITGLNYKITDLSNNVAFYQDQMYGSEGQPGFLNINAKQTEKFSNIHNTEGMIEGFDVSQTDLKNVINENKLLENQIQKNQNNYTTDDTQVFYKKQQFYRQKDLNYILYIIFYVLILGLAVYLFIFNNTINVYLKIFITILLAIYPFIIEHIEFFVYFIFYYVYSLVNGLPIDLGNYYGFTYK